MSQSTQVPNPERAARSAQCWTDSPRWFESLERPAPATCPFHDDRAQVRNGMCGECAEMADDAR